MHNDPPGAFDCAYIGQYHIEQFRRDLERMAGAAVGRVFLPMTEEDLLLRRGNLEAMIAETRAAGLEAWLSPWGVGGVFNGPRGSAFVALHPETRQVDSAGSPLPMACPNQAAFVRAMEKWIDAAADAGAQGVLWDEPCWARHDTLPHWREIETSRLWTCCCPECQTRFRAIFRADIPEDLDDDSRAFRAQTMAAFLCNLGEAAQRRGLPSALRVSPYGSPATWEAVSRYAWLAELSAAAHWALAGPMGIEAAERWNDFVRRTEAAWNMLERLAAAARTPTRAMMWTRCYKVPASEEDWIERGAAHLRSLGVRRFGAWAFGGAKSISALACERPDEAWQAAVRALSAR